MRFSILLFIIIICHLPAGAQTNPKQEFRAVWVATVANIDWPSKAGLSSDIQKQEIINILDRNLQLGMNAVILQVRPSSDAFYPSSLEPWSRYLTGIPGKMPDPWYDPLQFWVDECHKRNMELHAWLNPFRVALNHKQPLAGGHIAFKNPDWVLKYGNSLFFDPGLPQTREFVVQVVKDIVVRYDIDAIHFDDYFYPYPLGEEFPDTTSFSFYNRGFAMESKNDWRRENVDIIIKMINDTIKSVKPWVKFGISPFGVWRNKTDDPEGSETRAGTTNYDHLYADIIKWQKNGWIDYSMPQLYWQTGHPQVDFKTLADWWEQHGYGRSVYIGHAIYKSEPGSPVPEWRSPEELPRQIRITRQINGISGSAYYSSKHFNRNLAGFQDSLLNNYYRYPALIPPMPWLDDQAPPAVKKAVKRGRKVKWQTTETNTDVTDRPWQFVIYLNETGTPFNPADPRFIYTILNREVTQYKFSKINRKKKRYEVRVSVVDRLKNESRISEPVIIKR
ncbi:MAG: family 10 glycosylhydrolase [Prolixibacteraceae bacterium]|nr:family 10 glycosylhydrolase [Prolixibacteraceae bacterium]MDD4755953.1 family 10 glycosylhydrolase [Prolixibacteraceae bacterium]